MNECFKHAFLERSEVSPSQPHLLLAVNYLRCMDTKSIQKQVIEESFKNPEFSKAVAQAIGDNLLGAIRKIDDWNLEYEIKDLLKEAIFSDEFKTELKAFATSYVTENKEEIKKLVKENIAKVVTGGIIASSEKIGELLIKKVMDVKSIY